MCFIVKKLAVNEFGDLWKRSVQNCEREHKSVNSLVFLLMLQITDRPKLKRIPDYTWTIQIVIDYIKLSLSAKCQLERGPCCNTSIWAPLCQYYIDLF